MRTLWLSIVLSLVLTGCTEKDTPTAKTATEKQPRADVNAGRTIAERECRGCHGLEGKAIGPGIPHLAAQRAQYLLASLMEYKNGKRPHAAPNDMPANMSDADRRDVVAYYASLTRNASTAGEGNKVSSPYEEGKALATACAKCHEEDGNSKISGTPSLAGQQPRYLVTAIPDHHPPERRTRNSTLPPDKLELEKLGFYFASQTPAQRVQPPFGDPAAGKATSAACGGCHGPDGVSHDASTPSVAGQDPQYLVKTIKAYRTARRHWGLQQYVAGLSDQDIADIAAFYAIQPPRAAEKMPSSTQVLVEKCDRCHDADEAANAAPKMRGQDKDYLVMALRAYRDGKRESSTMHNMSSIYSNVLIDSVATWYASQPAK